MKKRISIILAAVMLISITVVAFALGTTTPTPKEDNPVSEWAQESIIKAGENNILESSRNYVYGNPITREEFCELIYNLIHNTSSKGIEIDYSDCLALSQEWLFLSHWLLLHSLCSRNALKMLRQTLCQ